MLYGTCIAAIAGYIQKASQVEILFISNLYFYSAKKESIYQFFPLQMSKTERTVQHSSANFLAFGFTTTESGSGFNI